MFHEDAEGSPDNFFNVSNYDNIGVSLTLNIPDTVPIKKTIVKKILFVPVTTIVSSTETLALGKVTGSIMCFPTSTGMLAAYYGLGADTSPPAMATQAYEVWRKERFLNRDTGPNLSGNNPEPSNSLLYLYRKITQSTPKESYSIWTIWEQMGKVMTERAKADSRFKQEKPWPDAAGQWKMHLHSSDNLLQASNHNHLRADISRGWPVVVGTNATAGHVMLIKGVLLNDDGSLNRVICNDPYGNLELEPATIPSQEAVSLNTSESIKAAREKERLDFLSKEKQYNSAGGRNIEQNTDDLKSDKGKGAYYSIGTQGNQSFAKVADGVDNHGRPRKRILGKRESFVMSNHFALRLYFDRDAIHHEKIVQGRLNSNTSTSKS